LQFIGLERPEDQHADGDYNNFVLDALPPASPYKDKEFADITGEARKQFFRYEICVRNLYTDNVKEIEDVFKRLNKFLMPLKPQELRNATYHGAFAKLSEHFADNEYWAVNRIVTAAAIRRMADIEMMSDLLIGLLHGPQGGSAKIIDQYYDQYEQFEDEFPGQGRIAKTFNKVLSLIEDLFPSIADSRWGNRADFYSLFVAFGGLLDLHVVPAAKEKKLREALLQFAACVDAYLENQNAKVAGSVKQYARAIEKASNDKARRADRHEVLVETVQPFLKEKK